MHKLSDSEIAARLAAIASWSLDGDTITRTLRLPSFPAALVFASAVGHLAEQANHHPDILIKYRNVTLTLSTHEARGLTTNDFDLAAEINDLVAK
jgi:4a-hydroxytetrahydrobiopterin dehydratase